MQSNINFHIHTVYSDGGKTPSEIVQLLKEKGVEYFAITDHDQIYGNAEAAKFAKECGLIHFDGIELSCAFSDGEIGLDESWVCHILGLGIDVGKMTEAWKELEAKKHERLTDLFALLKKEGYRLDWERVSSGGRIQARKAIARELVMGGYAKNADDCYETILNTEKYRCYGAAKPSLKEGIAVIHHCGGLAVWAHPFSVTRGGKKLITETQVLELCDSLYQYGLDGMEAYYHKYSAEQIAFLCALADGKNLLKSIGTDYHMASFDEKKHPEYIALREKESIVFDVPAVDPDGSALLKRLLQRRKP